LSILDEQTRLDSDNYCEEEELFNNEAGLDDSQEMTDAAYQVCLGNCFNVNQCKTNQIAVNRPFSSRGHLGKKPIDLADTASYYNISFYEAVTQKQTSVFSWD
jgi:hypothetical protein